VFGNQARRYAEWQDQRDAYAGMLHLVTQGYRGSPVSPDVRLAPGETVFYKVNLADLIQGQPGRGQDGRAPASAGRASVRPARPGPVRAAAGRRVHAQGRSAPAVVATGTAAITSRRVLFHGPGQVLEVQFARLAGVRHTENSTEFAMPGRDTPITIGYGPQFSRPFRFRLDFALASYRGTIDDLIRRLRADLAEIDAQRPA
jgi:hypothetical protein